MQPSSRKHNLLLNTWIAGLQPPKHSGALRQAQRVIMIGMPRPLSLRPFAEKIRHLLCAHLPEGSLKC